MPVFLAPTDLIASIIFSYTRGTVTKTVGFAFFSVSVSVPFSASGRAMNTVIGLYSRIIVSTYCAATWFSGRKPTMRSTPSMPIVRMIPCAL